MKIRILLCSTRLAGTYTQCKGVAQLVRQMLRARGINASVSRLSWLDRQVNRLPFARRLVKPAIVISCASLGERKARKFLKDRRNVIWAHIETPDLSSSSPDYVYVEQRDWQPAFDERKQFMKLHGVPHAVRREDLANRRADARRRLGVADESVAVFLIGGSNPAFNLDEGAAESLLVALSRCKGEGKRIFISTSRRTEASVVKLVSKRAGEGISAYTGVGPNPYMDYLAAADELFVTEDSVTMCCEALATGKPVYLLRLVPIPGPRLDSFRRFQEHFVDRLGVLGVYPDKLRSRCDVPDDTKTIAEALVAAYLGDKRRDLSRG